MRLGLLGIDEESLAVAVLAREAGVELSVGYAAAAERAKLAMLRDELHLEPAWESLLVGNRCDALLIPRSLPRLGKEEIGSASEKREEQLRRAVQEKIPLIIFPPACRLDVGYELEVYRRESQSLILPWIPHGNHPAWQWLAPLLSADSSLGKCEQCLWEVHLADRSRTAVLQKLAEDLPILRRLLGGIRTVTATAAHAETHYDPFAPRSNLPPLEQLQVQLGMAEDIVVRWQVSPQREDETATIQLIGTQGRAELKLHPDLSRWSGLLIREGTREEIHWPQPPSLWQDYSQLIARPGLRSELIGMPTWLDQCRDLEILEAIDRSLVKGRSVAVHAEETSEADAFKGTMASAGCLVLMFVLLVLMGVLLVEGLQLPIRNYAIWRYWPGGLVVCIVIFLLMQSLGVLVRSPREPHPPTK